MKNQTKVFMSDIEAGAKNVSDYDVVKIDRNAKIFTN